MGCDLFFAIRWWISTRLTRLGEIVLMSVTLWPACYLQRFNLSNDLFILNSMHLVRSFRKFLKKPWFVPWILTGSCILEFLQAWFILCCINFLVSCFSVRFSLCLPLTMLVISFFSLIDQLFTLSCPLGLVCFDIMFLPNPWNLVGETRNQCS